MVNNGVGTITFNRPEQRNALSRDLIDAFGDHLTLCMEDEAVRVIVLTNAGGTFCAGANLSAAGETPRYTLVDVLKLMCDGPKVVVGRINGHCTGGGVGIAAACDLSVISKAAQVGFTEVRIGVSPAIISVVCLPKMRRGDAAALMLSGEKISASLAVEVGLFNWAVDAGDVDAKVADVVEKVVLGGPMALAATKGLVYKVPQMPREEAFQWTADVSAKCFKSQEAVAGITAFRKKQPAPWVPVQSLQHSSSSKL